MPKLPNFGVDAIRALEKFGFVQVRQRGRHVVLEKITETSEIGCLVPRHDELATGTLRGILGQAQVDPEALIKVR